MPAPHEKQVAGDDPFAARVWNSLLHMARELASDGAKTSSSDAAAQAPRLEPGQEKALVAVMLAGVATEFRLKRTLIFFGKRKAAKEKKFEDLIDEVWDLLRPSPRWKGNQDGGQGNCAKPESWPQVKQELHALRAKRNQIAHADIESLRQWLGETASEATRQAAIAAVNTAVSAIEALKEGTGYFAGPWSEARKELDALRLEPK